MFMQPAAPGFHQSFGLPPGVLVKMQHAAGAPSAGAALGVAVQHFLLLEEVDGLMQHRFGQSQLGMVTLKALKQSRGVAVVLQQAVKNPADRQFEIKKKRRWLPEIVFDVSQAGARRFALGEHEIKLSRFCLTRSRSDFQAPS